MQSVSVMNSSAATGFGSAVDSNRFYSMLLDARAASVTENMHDVSEKLLKGEKDNAKLALDQLWALKKTLTDGKTDDSIERMISYYQGKINVLREKEENIKKLGKDTRALVEEKKKRDEELAQVRTHIGDCTRELNELNAKLDILGKREEELSSIERKLNRDISINENRIVSGLCEIVLRRPESVVQGERESSGSDVIARELAGFGIDTAAIQKRALAAEMEALAAAEADVRAEAPAAPPKAAEAVKARKRDADATDSFSREETEEPDVLNRDDEAAAASRTPADSRREQQLFPEPVVYPKSVVRMSGRVIGEYYHDGNIVSKEQRHYIYNSRFMAERMGAGVRSIKNRFNQDIYAEMIKIAEDVANRVRESKRFHFEVSTNEILNDKNLKQLSVDLRRRVWDDAERFAMRLAAKIEVLGSNYEAMLQEQMERCSERD